MSSLGERRAGISVAVAALWAAAVWALPAGARPEDVVEPAAQEQPVVAPVPAAPPVPPGKGPSVGRRRIDPRVLTPHYEFMEENYLDYFFPNVGPVKDRPLFFDAQAAIHLFVWNQWWKVNEKLPVGRWRWVNSLGVSFLLKVRMVQEFSAPVRPPSYMPRLDYQGFVVRRTAERYLDFFELRVTPWGHHSNGQQECEFADGVAQARSDPSALRCLRDIDRRHPPKPSQVNYRSGDFSTSYFIAGGHWARVWLDDAFWTRSRAGVGVLFEGNPRPWGPGTIGATESRLYGPWRLKGEAELRHRFDFGESLATGMGSITGSFEKIWTPARGIPGDREIVEVSYQPDMFRGMGGFVRFFSGQDTMNVLYAAGRTTQVAMGIIWSASPPLRYVFGREEQAEGDR